MENNVSIRLKSANFEKSLISMIYWNKILMQSKYYELHCPWRRELILNLDITDFMALSKIPVLSKQSSFFYYYFFFYKLHCIVISPWKGAWPFKHFLLGWIKLSSSWKQDDKWNVNYDDDDADTVKLRKTISEKLFSAQMIIQPPCKTHGKNEWLP